MVASIPVAFFLLAPPKGEAGGLGLGAIGLAIKVLLMQFILVHVQFYFITKLHKWRANALYFYQFFVISVLLLLGYGMKKATYILLETIGLTTSLPVVLVSYSIGCLVAFLIIWKIGKTSNLLAKKEA